MSQITLLDYAMTTHPSPIQVSQADGTLTRGALVFTVSNGTADAVDVVSIEWVIPVGTEAPQLTNDANAINHLVTAPGWLLTMTSPGLFKLVPEPGPTRAVAPGESLLVQFTNIPLNQIVGLSVLTIAETAASGTEPEARRLLALDVPKFPYGFFLDDFSASALFVANGGTVTLSWRGSDLAAYEILYGPPAGRVPVTKVRSWTSPPLTQPTSFVLRATVTERGETFTVDRSAAVLVADPDVTTKNLSVTGQSVLEKTDIHGLLTVTAHTDLADVTASGHGAFRTLGVTEHATLGSATVTGKLDAGGPVSVFRPPVPLTIGRYYRAPSDGYVIGSIDVCAFNYKCGASLVAATEGMSVMATGGWHPAWIAEDMKSFLVAGNQASLMMPVRRDAQFVTYQTGVTVQLSVPPMSAWWVGLGGGAPADDGPAVAVLDPEVASGQAHPREKVSHAIRQIVAVIERVLPDRLSPADRDELIEAIRALTS